MTRENRWTPFQRALVDSVLQEYDAILSRTPEMTPSAKFEQWGQDEICKHKRTHTVGGVLKGILIAAIIMALLAISAMAIPAVREAIIDFFLQEHADHYGITFDPDEAATAPSRIENQYHISYTPEEYVLVAEDVSLAGVSVFWMAEDGRYISFTQWIIQKGTEDDVLGLDNGGERTSIIIDGYWVEIIIQEETRKLVWTNNEYYFVLEVPCDMPQEEIDKIFTSWGPKEE